MSDVIREYYEKTGMMPNLLESKISQFNIHTDIMNEFEYWILNKKYKDDNEVNIQGYTAKALSELSPYLKGEGSFILLMELRDNPDKALRRIESGLKKK